MQTPANRRQFLETFGLGFGALALSCLMEEERALANPHGRLRDMAPRLTHFAPQAKSVIMLFQNGGASQMDLFDPKPELTKRHGKKAPANIRGGNANGASKDPLMGSAFKFRPYGESGIEFSNVIPGLTDVVDDLCVVRSMYSNDPNHPGATYMMCTGNNRPGRPTLGAWVTYGLGSENRNLPGYVCLRDPGAFHSGGGMQITNGFLPSLFRGTELRSEGDPVLNLRREKPPAKGVQASSLDLLAKLNNIQRNRFPDNQELKTRIKNYELAARMQLTAAEELDLSQETQETKNLYCLHNKEMAGYGRRLLLARRLVERGVRFVQVLPPPPHSLWDHHGSLNRRMKSTCAKTDRPAAALIKDLKRRGLLNETLVIWTGEFGRLPTSQGGTGRDHNPHGFSLFMAGGGLKKGFVYGETDELGYAAVENRVSVPDLMATVLHQLGLNHNRLTYNVHGISETLTDSKVSGAQVVHDLIG